MPQKPSSCTNIADCAAIHLRSTSGGRGAADSLQPWLQCRIMCGVAVGFVERGPFSPKWRGKITLKCWTRTRSPLIGQSPKATTPNKQVPFSLSQEFKTMTLAPSPSPINHATSPTHHLVNYNHLCLQLLGRPLRPQSSFCEIV